MSRDNKFVIPLSLNLSFRKPNQNYFCLRSDYGFIYGYKRGTARRKLLFMGSYIEGGPHSDFMINVNRDLATLIRSAFIQSLSSSFQRRPIPCGFHREYWGRISWISFPHKAYSINPQRTSRELHKRSEEIIDFYCWNRSQHCRYSPSRGKINQI